MDGHSFSAIVPVLLQAHGHCNIKAFFRIVCDLVIFHSHSQIGIKQPASIGLFTVQNPLKRFLCRFQPFKKRKVIICGLRPAICEGIGDLGEKQVKTYISQPRRLQNIDFLTADQGQGFILVIDFHFDLGRGDGHKHTIQVHFVCHYSCTPSSDTSSFSAKSLAHASIIPSRSVSLEMWFSLCCSTLISAVVNRLIASRSAISRI